MEDVLISNLTALGATPAAADLIEIETSGGASRKVRYDELVPGETVHDLSELTSVEGDDWALVTDRSDTTDHASGTDKKAQIKMIRGGRLPPIFKTSDEARNTTTTLADDGALIAPLEAGKTYLVRFRVIRKSASDQPDFKFGIAYTGTLTGDQFCRYESQSLNNSTETNGVSNALIASQNLFDGASGAGYLEVICVVTTSTAGNLKFQWAQLFSDANDSVVLKGSVVERTEILV